MAKDTERQIVQHLEQEFSELIKSLKDLVRSVPTEHVYILRSAAVVEQTCGGLTSNLWDDPFEWTLPETLNTPAKVLEYLNEVETLRNRAFLAFKNDADLSKEIMTPAGAKQILPFLLDTLNRARHHQQRAFTALEFLKLTASH